MTMVIHSSSTTREEDQHDDDGIHPQVPPDLPHSLTTVSASQSSMYSHDDYEYDHDCGNSSFTGDGTGTDAICRMFMSRLSIETCFDDDDGDGEELSDSEKEGRTDKTTAAIAFSSDDSDEPIGFCSLPSTPPRRRKPSTVAIIGVKDYASDNEAQKTTTGKSKRRWRRRRTRKLSKKLGRWPERAIGALDDIYASNNYQKNKKEDDDVDDHDEDNIMPGANGGGCWNRYVNRHYGNSGFSGESESGAAAGAGLMVITKPKGGRRSLCMDLEEVQACRDLGFELEHERMLEMMPSRLSLSASTLDTTSSGGNSPIANWRISSPGDDPRDVKARLKVWAQAVAIASTSRHGGG